MADTVTETAEVIAGYTVDAGTKSLTLAASGNVITFIYTPNTNISYTVHYYLKGTTTSVTPSKTVPDQTMATLVTETAIAITGYTLSGAASQTITLAASGNVIIFYYTANTYMVGYNASGAGAVRPTGQSNLKTGVLWSNTNLLPAQNPIWTGKTVVGWKLIHASSPAGFPGAPTDGPTVTNATPFSALAASDKVMGIMLLAIWKDNTYSIGYNAGHISAVRPAGQSNLKTGVLWNDGNLLPAQNPTRTGYTLIGWKLVHASSPAGFPGAPTDGPIVTNADLFRALAANDGVMGIQLLAQRTLNTYTVEFVDHDGTAIGTQTINHGSGATAPANPTRTGYTFDGWDTPFNNVTDNLTVTAQYTAIPYKVAYDANGGYARFPATFPTYIINDRVTVTDRTPTRVGHIFMGWLHNGTTYQGGDPFTMPATDVTFIAQRTPITYEVAFKANGGTGTMTNQTFTYDVTQNLTGNRFSRDQHTFLGWAITATGTVVYTGGCEVVNLTGTDGAIVNLYAVWKYGGG